MERRLTKRQFLKGMTMGLTSIGLVAGSKHSIFGSENEGDEMKNSGFIQTVRGRIAPGELGLTLIHEHIMVDFIGADKVNKGRYDPDEVFEVMLPYLKEIKALGVTGFGDCGPMFLGRDPELLVRLSKAADMHILTNTGLYKEPYIPQYAFEKSADELAEIWIGEMENGIEGTGVKPGFIKIAVNPGSLIPVQQKIVRAAARTSRATGLTIASHTGHGGAAMETLDILEEEGVPLNKYIFVHAGTDKDHDVAQRGGWVEYDGISKEQSARYIQLIKDMLDKGLEDNLLLSQDAGWYNVGQANGGNIRDFAYLIKEFVPLMKDSGIDQGTIDKLLIENPARALSIQDRQEDAKSVNPKRKAISTFGGIK